MVEKEAARLLGDLMFAYINKDEDFPHDFEVKAFEEALCFLKEHYLNDKYNMTIFDSHLASMKQELL